MAYVAGSDGCRAGSICLTKDLTTGSISAEVFADAQALIDQTCRLDVLAIDIPIGLPRKGSRQCDLDARQKLGPGRASSVFPAPIRPALRARDSEDASTITESVDGRRVSLQAFALFGKIREVDDLLLADPTLRDRVHEVHPEVSFWAWNGCRSMPHNKKTRDGRADRCALVASYFGAAAYADVRQLFLVKVVARDDILDAFAALWTAERIYRGEARVLPEKPTVDGNGLRMAIVY